LTLICLLVLEGSGKSGHYWATSFPTHYKSASVSSGLQGDVDCFLWEVPKYLWRPQSYRLRAKTGQTEDTEGQRPGGWSQEDHQTSQRGTPRGCVPTLFHQLWLFQWCQQVSWA